MSEDFDVVTGPAAPPKIKPAIVPARSEKMAVVLPELKIVVPAKADTQEKRTSLALDSRLRGNDDGD